MPNPFTEHFTRNSLGLNPGFHDEKLATNHLIYDTAILLELLVLQGILSHHRRLHHHHHLNHHFHQHQHQQQHPHHNHHQSTTSNNTTTSLDMLFDIKLRVLLLDLNA